MIEKPSEREWIVPEDEEFSVTVVSTVEPKKVAVRVEVASIVPGVTVPMSATSGGRARAVWKEIRQTVRRRSAGRIKAAGRIGLVMPLKTRRIAGCFAGDCGKIVSGGSGRGRSLPRLTGRTR